MRRNRRLGPRQLKSENVGVDFAMRYDGPYRLLAIILGTGPRRTTIRVADGVLRIRHGWVIAIDIPLGLIKSARLISERPLGWGVHQFRDGWLIRGSRNGIVELRFTRPVKPTKVAGGGDWLSAPVGSVYVSLADPGGFLAALKLHA